MGLRALDAALSPLADSIMVTANRTYCYWYPTHTTGRRQRRMRG